MGQSLKKLTARQVQTLTKPGLHSDGGGLYLEIDASGAKRWTFIYQWNKKRKQMGLGSTAARSLADARAAAEKARGQVVNGIDPVEARKAERAASRGVTFGEVADQVIEALKPGWKNAKHADQWEMTLREYVPFRDKPVAMITTEDVKGALDPIWLTIPDTASRLRGRIERVLDSAKVLGLREGENPARWRGHMKLLMPKQPKLTRGHHAAMPWAEVPAFWADLAGRNGMGVQALKFLLLTLGRTTEVTHVQVKEIDLKARVWTVPAGRMKGAKEHRVPLCDAALKIAKGQILPGAKPDDWLFPGTKKGKPISSATMEAVLERMEIEGATVHGFRSSFRDWVGEETTFDEVLAEMSLAHVVGDETEIAYRRGDALKRRRELLEAWEAFVINSPARRDPAGQ